MAAGNRLGPLHGIPIALKDIIDMEGRVTTGGSMVWRERISPTTATIARRLNEAGMIVIGKTHSVEFAMGGWGTNTHMGTPRNPWDLETHRTPGGSSSGSGVAVAAGMVPAAIGTDAGGAAELAEERAVGIGVRRGEGAARPRVAGAQEGARQLVRRRLAGAPAVDAAVVPPPRRRGGHA